MNPKCECCGKEIGTFIQTIDQEQESCEWGWLCLDCIKGNTNK
jgi:hypothetical protein